MARFRIVNSLDGKSLYQKGANPFNETQMEEDIVRYWGNTFDEKFFIIPFWKAKELVNNSESNQVAFRVFDINNPSGVHTEWISYAPNSSDEFVQERVYDGDRQITVWITRLVTNLHQTFFVFGNDLLDLFEAAIVELRVIPKYEFIIARLGETVGGETTVYFILGKIELHLGPSAGGASNACGAKLPPR